MAEVRKPVIAGNWKMHNGPAATREFFSAFLGAFAPRNDRTVLFFPPALSLTAAVQATSGRTDIGLGVQNVYWEPKGAFTGEISAPLAKEAGAAFVLVGHSERRHVFHESDQDVARKVKAVFDAGLTPVVCVGELLEERQAGRTESVVLRQLAAGLEGLDAAAIARVAIAYEPVWAIGTGVNATPADAAAVHRVIRLWLRDHTPPGARARVLYGGSVNASNAAELLAEPELDGVLVGGASLDADSWVSICQAR